MADVWVCLICERGVANTSEGLANHNEQMHSGRMATATRESKTESMVTIDVSIDGDLFPARALAVKKLKAHDEHHANQD